MLATVTLDDELLEEARQLGKHHTAKDAAIAALKEYVAFQSARNI